MFCLGPTTEGRITEKGDSALQVPQGPFSTGGGGDPELHGMFWMEGQWERPERPTIHMKGIA